MSNSPVVISAVRAYGVPPSVISHIAINNWTIADSFKDCFDIYYLLHWQSQYLLEQIHDGALNITDNKFIVVYHRTTRGKLLSAPYNQVAISFRKAKPEFGIPAYCLVSLQTRIGA